MNNITGTIPQTKAMVPDVDWQKCIFYQQRKASLNCTGLNLMIINHSRFISSSVLIEGKLVEKVGNFTDKDLNYNLYIE